MEGMEFVGQPRHEAVVVVDHAEEAVVVVDHAEEALETDLIGGHGEVANCLDPELKGHDA